MKDNTIDYSIIIPHRNIPNLLKRCLDSIPRRNDIQIIIVDDNSDIGKVDFEHFPGIGEKCVEVYFQKEGRGAGYARNVGIKHAKGKWLLFADADDTYTSTFAEFLTRYKYVSADVVYFKANIVYGVDSRCPFSLMNYYIDQYINNRGSLNDVKFGAWEPWNKMIKRELVCNNDIQFDEIPASNDKMFSLKVGEIAKDVLVVDNRCYNYIIRGDSIIHGHNYERFRCTISTSLNQNILYRRAKYRRRIFIPLLFFKNIRLVTAAEIKMYLNYLVSNSANPFEGFISDFIHNLIIRLRNRKLD